MSVWYLVAAYTVVFAMVLFYGAVLAWRLRHTLKDLASVPGKPPMRSLERD